MDSPPQRVNQRRLQRPLETVRQRESPNKNVKWETETKHETERERKKNDLEFSVCVLQCVQPGQQTEAAKQNQPALTNQSGLHQAGREGSMASPHQLNSTRTALYIHTHTYTYSIYYHHHHIQTHTPSTHMPFLLPQHSTQACAQIQHTRISKLTQKKQNAKNK